MTKVRDMERRKPWMQPRSHIHSFENVGECEGITDALPSGLALWELESRWIFKFLKNSLKGQNSLYWRLHYTIKNFLRFRCSKWARMIHLNTYNTSYGRMKGWESKCQFDSWSPKVWNHLELCVCRKCATYHWKLLTRVIIFLQTSLQ